MANFELYKQTALKFEGGYQKIVSDPGNYNSEGILVGTKYGISAPTYQRWIKRVPTEEDMRNISLNTAAQIFKTWYWDAVKASSIVSQAVAEAIVDMSINAGPGMAIKIAQRVLNKNHGKKLVVDGAIGAKTLAAINSTNDTDFFKRYSHARLKYYKKIGNSAWYPIWKKRVEDLAKKFGIIIQKKK